SQGYVFNSSSPHYVVLALGGAEPKIMGLRAGISDYNLLDHNEKKLQTQLSLISPTQTLIYISTLPNAYSARVYMITLLSKSLLFKEFKKGEYNTFLISKSNFEKLLKRKDVAEYVQFYNSKYPR